MGKILTFLKSALNFLNILQVALKYSNKERWGGEGRRNKPSMWSPLSFYPSSMLVHLIPTLKLLGRCGFSLGQSWSRSSLSSPVKGSTELLPWHRKELLGVLLSDLPRTKEQSGLWTVTQNGHGTVHKFTINVLPKENISTIDYLLITILLDVLYLWKGTVRRLLLLL